MNILLINDSPIVSRLLMLCTRDDSLTLHEVTEANDVTHYDYDIIFVDNGAYDAQIPELLSRLTKTKRIFISYNNDAMLGFDETIKKPFLPSKIIDIIQNRLDQNNTTATIPKDVPHLRAQELQNIDEEEALSQEQTPSIFPLQEETKDTKVLDENEIEKIKALLNMDDEITPDTEALRDEDLEVRKIELIKEQLISEGLEIVDESEIVEELSLGIDGTLRTPNPTKKKTTTTKKSNKKNKHSKIKFTEENMEHIEDAVEMAMATMTKKQMKKLLKGKEIQITIKPKEMK